MIEPFGIIPNESLNFLKMVNCESKFQLKTICMYVCPKKFRKKNIFFTFRYKLGIDIFFSPVFGIQINFSFLIRFL